MSGIPSLLARALNPARSVMGGHNAPVFPEATKMAVFEPYGYFDIFIPELMKDRVRALAG
jgi:hypothetical protein